jgi:hypothetical protein
VWLATWRALSKPMPSVDNAPPRSVVLAGRWVRLRSDAVILGEKTVASHADAVVGALVDRYGAEVLELPLYPAFR